MRVCLLIPALDAFKGGNHLPLLAALPEVEFTILTSRVKPPDAVLPRNIRLEFIDARLGSYYYGCADWRFGRVVLRSHPINDPFWKAFDVIHLNQTMGPALLELKKMHVPLLFFIHHPVSADRQVALEESSMVEGWRWRLKYALLLHWQRRFVREIAHVATVSHTAAQRIASDYGRPVDGIGVVPNGIDSALFTPGDLASSGFDVIAIGSFVHPRKGFRYLVEAYRELSAKGLRIADVGRRSAVQQAALRGIPNVRRVGIVKQEELLSLLRRSSVLLSTSLYEGFGLSLIEALACGRPSFAFDAGAVREVLQPIDPGLIVPTRNAKELVRRVLQFLQVPVAERVSKGEHYRAEVVRLYPLESSAQALHRLYERIAT